MDADNAWVNREDDDDTDRVYYVCVECPRKDKCSAQSWSRAKCWSYNDELTCQEKVAHHLMTSSLHYLSKEDAESVAAEGVYEVRVETPAEREQYRNGIEEQHRRVVAPVTDGAADGLIDSLHAQVGVVLAPRAGALRLLDHGQRRLRPRCGLPAGRGVC